MGRRKGVGLDWEGMDGWMDGYSAGVLGFGFWICFFIYNGNDDDNKNAGVELVRCSRLELEFLSGRGEGGDCAPSVDVVMGLIIASTVFSV